MPAPFPGRIRRRQRDIKFEGEEAEDVRSLAVLHQFREGGEEEDEADSN